MKDKKDLLEIIKENTIDTSCYFYNKGGYSDSDFLPNDIKYGDRCELHMQYFYRDKNNRLEPNCYDCKKNDFK